MPPSPIALDQTLGAAFIGNILAACLYGLTTLQTYTYYLRSDTDSRTLKALIGILWVLDMLHLILISHTVYVSSVSKWGNIDMLLTPPWSLLAHVVVTGISDGIIRGIFCHRIWILSDSNRWLCAAITFTSLVAFSGSLAYPIKGFQFHTDLEFTSISWLLYFSLSTTLVTEVIITSALCILLSRHRSIFVKVDLTIRTLILYAVNTGALTTLCTLLCIVAYAVLPHTFAFMAFYFLLPKLFLNSLLATLNARKSLRKRMRGDLAAFSLGPPPYARQSLTERARRSVRAESDMIGVLDITG